MNHSEIEKKVIECVAASLVKDSTQMNTKTLIISELGADSLDFMDIIFQLESAFGLRLQKEDFDFILRTGISRESAIIDGVLSDEAKIKLKNWLPTLAIEKALAPKDLAQFVSIESMVKVIEENLNKKSGA